MLRLDPLRKELIGYTPMWCTEIYAFIAESMERTRKELLSAIYTYLCKNDKMKFESYKSC